MSFRLLYVIMVRVSGWLLLLSRSDPLDRGRRTPSCTRNVVAEGGALAPTADFGDDHGLVAYVIMCAVPPRPAGLAVRPDESARVLVRRNRSDCSDADHSQCG